MEKLLDSSVFPIVLECVVTLLATYILARGLKYLIKRVEKGGIHHRFLANTLVAVVWVIGCMTAMSEIPGLSKVTRTLLAGSGIMAVIVGLAAQNSFSNLFSGLFISLFRPFEIGDRIKLVDSGITGYIEDITLRHTVIRTYVNNSRIIVPNSTMNSEIIENSDFKSTTASNFVDISISYESDLGLAMRIMADVIGSHELYQDQRTPAQIAAGANKVQVHVQALGESSINLRARMWTKTVDENFQACSDARIRIMEEFRAQGVEIPYNRLVILDRGSGERQKSDRRSIS